jgi:RNA polymerase sigma factor (sigma-70 family)
MKVDPEQVLIDRAAAGDADALSDLLEKHGPGIRAELEGQINPQWQSFLTLDDVMQQTYLDAFLSIARLRTREVRSFRGWLAQQARRNLTDAVRMLQAEKRGGRARQVSLSNSDESSAILLDCLCATGSTPSRAVAGDEARQILEKAMQELPAVYRQVIRLCDLDGQPAANVSGILGRSEGAVHMLRARAQDRLAEILGESRKFFSDPA